jgi:hypothetical protein
VRSASVVAARLVIAAISSKSLSRCTIRALWRIAIAAIKQFSGISNTVTITGHCVNVTVSGVENQVTVDTADAISASGFDNRVIYHFGSPAINSGGSNVVEQG